MNENFDLVIFDCDGVLVDSEVLAVEIDRRVLADLGWQLSIDEIVDKFVGKSSATFASSGDHEKIRRTLGLTNLLTRFDGRIFSATEVAHGKPAPDLFLFAAERMKVAPERCVVIEDSKYGVRAAHAAGMHPFGYAGGLTPAKWLATEGATVFTEMAELPDLLRAHKPRSER